MVSFEGTLWFNCALACTFESTSNLLAGEFIAFYNSFEGNRSVHGDYSVCLVGEGMFGALCNYHDQISLKA